MMRALVSITLVGTAAGAASAQAVPVLPPQPCSVNIARAPDDVRAVIEMWVRAEHKCTNTVEVRVVPTEGGLYLFARDPQGFVRERIVPDAQSAGVLVASWIADDSFAPIVIATPQPPPAMAEPTLDELLVLPRAPGQFGIAPGIRAKADVRRERPPIPIGVTAGAFTGEGHRGGRVDLELGLKRRSRGLAGAVVTASLGVAESWFHDSSASSFASINASEVRIGAGLGWIWSTRTWKLHARAGLVGRLLIATDGLMSIDGQPWSDLSEHQRGPGAVYGGEASLLVSRRLGEHWGVFAGPILEKEFAHDALPEVSYDPGITAYGGITYQP